MMSVSDANRLIARLQKELPPLGYTPITPQGTESSIVTFQCKDAEAVRRKIRASSAKILLTGPNSALTVGRFGNHVRFSVSVFNNDKDVDTILAYSPERWRLPLRTLEQTGMRVGELQALVWADVDEHGCRFRVKHGKTAAARRWAWATATGLRSQPSS